MAVFRRGHTTSPSEAASGATALASEGSIVTALVSAMALLFSVYSVYETSIRRPDLRAFAPPAIQYSSPYNNSTFEVFAIPVTLANVGARTGTVLSLELEVRNAAKNVVKRFYSAEFGRWTMENARTGNFRSFAPMAIGGKSAVSESILFYTRDGETVQQIVESKSELELTLRMRTAMPEDLGYVDRLWASAPAPISFKVRVPEIDHRVFLEGALTLYANEFAAAP